MNSQSKTPTSNALAALLSVSASGDVWPVTDLSALFHHQLRAPFEGGTHSLDHILLGDGCNLEDLGRVKEWAKAARTDADSGLPSAVCHVLYYAAIAAASARCGRRLTSLPDVDLKVGFTWALAQTWIPDSIRQLFEITLVAIDQEN